jgi:hypothetical protein
LGFGLFLKFFELEARFPRGPEEFPPSVVSDPAEFPAYLWSGREEKLRAFAASDPVVTTQTAHIEMGKLLAGFVRPAPTSRS